MQIKSAKCDTPLAFTSIVSLIIGALFMSVYYKSCLTIHYTLQYIGKLCKKLNFMVSSYQEFYIV